jgi:hypothetical protein
MEPFLQMMRLAEHSVAETSTSAAVRLEDDGWLMYDSARMLQPLYHANPPLSTS